MFDGRIARAKKNRTDTEKKFGIQIDSLCDVICFGVLPATIAYSFGMRAIYYIPTLILFVLGAVIRLAYFNVTEEERQSKTDSARVYYEGLPVTSSALIIPFVCCMQHLLKSFFVPVLSVVMLAVAILFVSPFKLPKADKVTSIILILLGITEFVSLIIISF